MRFVAVLLAMLAAPHGAFAQETIALAIEGWRAETREGVTYYRCASQICAAGSTVSYKEQPHRTNISMAEFEKHHRGLADMNKGIGRIRDVRLTEMKERTVEGVRVMQAFREVDWADNKTVFTIEARLIGPGRSFSLVSDSPKREWTVNNFEGFLRALVDDCGPEGLTEILPTRVPTVARGARIGDNAATKNPGGNMRRVLIASLLNSPRCRRWRTTTSCCAAWARSISAGASPR